MLPIFIAALLGVSVLAAPFTPGPANHVSFNEMRLPTQVDSNLCLGLASRWWGETAQLLPCSSDATKLVMRSDNLLGFGTPRDHPLCLDVAEGDASRPAQGWACWDGNPNQEMEWMDTGAYQRLRWIGTNKCLQVPAPVHWSGGRTQGGAVEGVQVSWGDCDAENPLQRWGWVSLHNQW